MTLVGANLRTRRVMLLLGFANAQGLLLSGDKCSVLWVPDASIPALLPHARLLGAEWAINWSFGIDVETAAQPTSPKTLPRCFDRSR